MPKAFVGQHYVPLWSIKMIGFISFYSGMETEGSSTPVFFESNVGNFDLNKMHQVDNGDLLRIFDKNDQRLLWSGTVDFTHGTIERIDIVEYKAYETLLFQKGEDIKTWNSYFIGNYPAELIKNVKVI